MLIRYRNQGVQLALSTISSPKIRIPISRSSMLGSRPLPSNDFAFRTDYLTVLVTETKYFTTVVCGFVFVIHEQEQSFSVHGI